MCIRDSRYYLPDTSINYLYNVPKELIGEMLTKQQAVVIIPSTGHQVPFLENCVGIKVKENVTFCIGCLTRQHFHLSPARCV